MTRVYSRYHALQRLPSRARMIIWREMSPIGEPGHAGELYDFIEMDNDEGTTEHDVGIYTCILCICDGQKFNRTFEIQQKDICPQWTEHNYYS